MWQKFLDTFVKIMTFVHRMDALEKKVKDQEQEIRQLTTFAQQVVFELQRTTDKVDDSTQREALEREKLLLQVELQLLKANRQLPPLDDDKEKK